MVCFMVDDLAELMTIDPQITSNTITNSCTRGFNCRHVTKHAQGAIIDDRKRMILLLLARTDKGKLLSFQQLLKRYER